MGREIRKVPPNWSHPTEMRFCWQMRKGYTKTLSYVAMNKGTFAEALADWQLEKNKWNAGERPSYFSGDDQTSFEEYHGDRPDPKHYEPFTAEEATWYQLWETVSEGTPVSPPFATLEELAAYLAEWGDFWDQSRAVENMALVEIERLLLASDHRHEFKAGWGKEAAEAFCRSGWAPSMVVAGDRVLSNAGEIAAEAAKATGSAKP